MTNYEAACALVALIETNLSLGRTHYRAKSGQILTTLDEVINAILTHTLQEPQCQTNSNSEAALNVTSPSSNGLTSRRINALAFTSPAATILLPAG